MTEIGWNVGVIVIMGICAVMDCLWKKVWMPLVWGMGVYILIWTLMSGEFSGERIMTQFLPGVLVAVILYTASVLTQGQIGRADGIVMGQAWNRESVSWRTACFMHLRWQFFW